LAGNGSFLSLSVFGLYFFHFADNLIKIFLNSLCRIALEPPLPSLREWNYPLMSPLNSGIFLPQDPNISEEIANSRTNIGSEGGLSAEVNYLSENPLMPDQLVSAAPSLDHPNQNYLGTPMEDDWEKIF
jgi:hypothetical protein